MIIFSHILTLTKGEEKGEEEEKLRDVQQEREGTRLSYFRVFLTILNDFPGLLYLGLSRSIYDYLGASRCILVYLGLPQTFLDYLGLSRTI